MQYEESPEDKLAGIRSNRRKAIVVFTGALSIEAIDSTLLSTAPNIVKLAVGVIGVGAAFCESFTIAFSTLDIRLVKKEMEAAQTTPPVEEAYMEVRV